MDLSLDLSRATSDRRLVIGLAAASLVLTVLYWKFNIERHPEPRTPAIDEIVRLVDLNGEGNLAAWFAGMLWGVASLTALSLSRIVSGHSGLLSKRFYWGALSVLFMFLSIDEVAQFHEGAGRLAGPLFVGYPVYASAVIALLFALTVAMFTMRFILSLPRGIALSIFLAAAVFLTGAVGFESLGALVEYRGEHLMPPGFDWTLLILAEELLEMLGVILLIATLRYYRRAVEKEYVQTLHGPPLWG